MHQLFKKNCYFLLIFKNSVIGAVEDFTVETFRVDFNQADAAPIEMLVNRVGHHCNLTFTKFTAIS